MTELNMYPTWSFVRMKATYTNRISTGGVSYAPFRHFVLLKKYIVYGQGPIACMYCFITQVRNCVMGTTPMTGLSELLVKSAYELLHEPTSDGQAHQSMKK